MWQTIIAAFGAVGGAGFLITIFQWATTGPQRRLEMAKMVKELAADAVKDVQEQNAALDRKVEKLRTGFDELVSEHHKIIVELEAVTGVPHPERRERLRLIELGAA